MMNKYNPNTDAGNRKGLPHRKSIRLKGYDYSQAGLYFITICVQNRECLFGEIVGAGPCGCPEMILNDAGIMIDTEWLNLKTRFPNIELHEYVVMPNHFHAILEIVGATLVVEPNDDSQNDSFAPNDDSQNDSFAPNDNSQKGQPQGITPTDTIKNKNIGDMMDAFKSITTVQYIRGVKTLDWQTFDGKLWQRNYYEHIIRNDKSYNTITEYIINNPSNWMDDKFYII